MPKSISQKADTRKWFLRYKKTLKCRYCRERDPACLEFHHHNPHHKKAGIAALVSAGSSIARITAELALCSVVCANCHRKIHAKRRAEGRDFRGYGYIPVTDLAKPNALAGILSDLTGGENRDGKG